MPPPADPSGLPRAEREALVVELLESIRISGVSGDGRAARRYGVLVPDAQKLTIRKLCLFRLLSHGRWDRPLIGGSWSERYDRSDMLPAGDSRMEWTLRLVGTEIDGQSRSCEVMAISRPDGLGDIAALGLTLAEASTRCFDRTVSHAAGGAT